MKNLLRYLAFAQMFGCVFAQSNLPACQGSSSNWSDCFGTYFFEEGQWKGDKYVGTFKNGKFDGQGTYFHLANIVGKGDIYVGEYKDGKRSGQGTYHYLANGPGKGDKYVGEFKGGMRNGQGAYLRANGNVQISEYQNGDRHGRFIEYKSDGTRYRSGVYEQNELVRLEIVNPSIFNRIPPNVNPVVVNYRRIIENERLRAEAEEAKKKNAEVGDRVPLVEQQTTQTQATQPSVTQSRSKRIALVIGNANYKVRPLKNPRNDADDISRSLRFSGFEIIDLRDASLQQMRNGVRQFGDRLINNDVGLVYYSGHGVEVKGRNYFIPVNADIMREDEIADQGLDVSLILEKMNTAGKGVNILIVDACRDDPFGRSFRSTSRGLAAIDAPRGIIIAYATSPGKVASDGDGRNSPYTKNLVKVMQQPNKPIELVFKEVRRAVQEETKNQQTPWESTSLSGDFYFKEQ